MKKWGWLAAWILILAIPLAFLLKDMVRDLLLVELMRLIWTVRILLDALPQVLIWSVFLLVVLNVAVRSLLPGKRSPRWMSEPALEPMGQVRSLAMRIRSAARGEYYAWNLARYLGRLVADVLAYSQATMPERTIWQVRTGNLSAPAEVRGYLQAGRGPPSAKPLGLVAKIEQFLTAGPQPQRPDPPLEAVVQFLEERLED